MSSNDAILRLHAAASALGDVDVSGWDDAALHDHLDELSAALCRVDEHLCRIADAVRARGFRIAEPPVATDPTHRQDGARIAQPVVRQEPVAA